MINPTPPGQNCSKEDIWQQPSIIQWTQLLLDSYRHWMKQELIDRGVTFSEQSHQLFESSFVVVSHGMQNDPILNYGNRTALALWEMSWEELTSTRHASPPNLPIRKNVPRCFNGQHNMDSLMIIEESAFQRPGKRFLVERAIVWNVVDDQGQKQGQAATFSKWSFLKSS